MNTYHGRHHSKTYRLANALRSGGEGDIYNVKDRPDLVAKIFREDTFKPTVYCKDPAKQMEQKILTMLDQPVNSHDLGNLIIAWPADILYSDSGKFVGYVMPKVNKELFIFSASRELERKMYFKNYSFETAVNVAFNLAWVVKKVHETGAVVGDMNPLNIMLDSKGLVTLIDTDSFSIRNKTTGQVFPCTVGVPEMLAPELQVSDLRDNVPFTRESDNFSLAIHIFNLLMNNIHPFGCISGLDYHPSRSNNQIAHSIVKGACPYVTHGHGVKSASAPDYQMLPDYIRTLFDRAFTYTSRTALKRETIAGRPTAEEWWKALHRLMQEPMTTCRKGHVYPAQYHKGCPWCALESGGNGSSQSSSCQTASEHSHSVPSPSGGTGCSISAVEGKAASRRPGWPLWMCCLMAGIFTAPAMSPWIYSLLSPILTGLEMTLDAATAGMLILGIISGYIVGMLVESNYVSAFNGWPWLLSALMVPLVSLAILLVLVLAIMLFEPIVHILLFAVGALLFLLFLVCLYGCN